jgi:predicted DNA-binding WGR domain protein
LDIYKINITSVKHFVALTKRESVRRFFVVVITDPTLLNTSTSDHEIHRKYDRIGDKKENSMCMHKMR